MDRFRAFDTVRNLEGKPFRSLCYAPNVQMSFSPTGNVSACCISRSHVLGNVRNEGLDDIWYGSRIREFSRSLQGYVFPRGCESCRWSLEAGNYLYHPIRQYDDLPILPGGQWPTKLEFALSNACNLGCIMCDSEYSSVLRAREGLPPMPRVFGDRFFQQLAPYLQHATSLTFLGGEPFMQRECYRIWDMLIDMELGIPCHVTTNGSIYNRRVEHVLHNLPFNLAISVDGVTKETIENIRVDVKYESLMENIRQFNAYVRGNSDRFAAQRDHRLQLNFCVMRQNWHEVADFFLFAEDLDCFVWKIFVTEPPSCSLFTLGVDELSPIVGTLDARTDRLRGRLKHNWDVWLTMVEEMRGHLKGKPLNASGDLRRGTQDSATDEKGSRERLSRAWQLNMEGRFEEAMREIEVIAEDDPQYYHLKCLQGEFQIGLRDFDGAARELRDAIAITAKRPEAYLIRAWLYVTEGKMGEAVAAARDATERVVKLRELEAKFIEGVLVKRLVQRDETLATVLSSVFSRQRETVAAGH